MSGDQGNYAADTWPSASEPGAVEFAAAEEHVHCPDCGCDPKDHTMHADGCRRINRIAFLQCGPPWNPWPQGLE